MSYKNFNPYANLKFNYMVASDIQNTYQSLNGSFNKVAMVNERLKYITNLFTKNTVFPSVDATLHLQSLLDAYKKLYLFKSPIIEAIQQQQQFIEQITNSFQLNYKDILPINILGELNRISTNYSDLISSIEWPEELEEINDTNKDIATTINDKTKPITISDALNIIFFIITTIFTLYTIASSNKSEAETAEFRNEVLNILNNQTQVLQQHNDLILQQNEIILKNSETIIQNSILFEQKADLIIEDINKLMDNLDSLNLPINNENIEH